MADHRKGAGLGKLVKRGDCRMKVDRIIQEALRNLCIAGTIAAALLLGTWLFRQSGLNIMFVGKIGYAEAPIVVWICGLAQMARPLFRLLQARTRHSNPDIFGASLLVIAGSVAFSGAVIAVSDIMARIAAAGSNEGPYVWNASTVEIVALTTVWIFGFVVSVSALSHTAQLSSRGSS